jgi:hypothetical protein
VRTSVVISSNGGAVALKVVSSKQWMGLESVASSGGAPSWNGSVLFNVVPSLTEKGNNLLTGVSVFRSGVGQYQIDWTSPALDPDKIQFICSPNQAGLAYPTIYDSNTIAIKVVDLSGANTDAFIAMEVEIKYFG